MQDWYVRRGDDVVDGPYGFEHLKELQREGRLGPEGLVRAGTRGDWLPLSSVLSSAVPADRRGTDWASLRFREAPAVPSMPRLPVEDDGWQQIDPAPWRRFFGRTFDIALFALSGGAILASLTAAYFPGAYETVFAERKGAILGGLVSTAVFYAWIVLGSALLLGLTGTTPGKWLFGTRITHRDGRPIGVWAALRRELSVLVTGQGLGLPVVALVANVFAYITLKAEGVSSWDAMERWVVTHRSWGPVQVALAAAAVVAPVLLVMVLGRLLEAAA
ncbi:RDD family protein [Pseudoxanthomonas koreensis]|uniref:RDD family protein n=1 Tax=Pseudoxanthomonas koreensis TaxID=266061 RepID=UPI0013918DB3|nr:RDD family protein [Pseudoxanthomonas koreensis]